MLFEKLYTILTLLTMDLFFRAAHGLAKPKRLPLPKMSYISYDDDTWQSYTLPKEDPKSKKSCDTPLEFC